MDFGNPGAIFVSSFIVALSGALMPGPLLAVTIRHASRRGFAAAPLLVLGHAVLEAGMLCLLLFGMAEWLRGEAAAALIALAGSVALLSMATGMAREVRTLRFEPGTARCAGGDADAAPGGWLRPVIDGVVTSASNPYWLVWWATIGLGYLLIARGQGAAGVLAFFGGHILADAAWYLFVGSTVSAGRGRFTDRAYRAVVVACAAFLAFFALSFGCFGMARLLKIL